MDTWHAVKVIRPELAQDAKMVELLRREAAALREIRHEAVVSYDGVFRDEFAFSGRDEVFKARGMVAYSIVPRMSPYLGAGLYAKVRGDDDDVAVRFGPEVCVGLEL